MRHETISPNHTLSKYEKKIGVTLHPKELQWILYGHVFAHICYVLQELARTEIYVKRSINSVINSHTETNMVSICL